MKEIIQFQANDGTIFASAQEATKRDALFVQCQAVESIIGAQPDLSGEEFKQHDPAACKRFKEALVALVIEQKVVASVPVPAAEVHPQCMIGRVLSEMGGPMNHLWYRLMCIDKQGREWNQPYFANKEGY